jgi:formylglycine-generating enzyme required for sulfatase activity
MVPATNISIANINTYLKWLSDKAGRQYRLPTLAEWQYAARASSASIDPNRNCKLNSRGIQKGSELSKTTLGQQNSWGLVNYLGNARELVLDRGGKYFAVGGSFDTEMSECSFANQIPHSGVADGFTGVRVLRELQ